METLIGAILGPVLKIIDKAVPDKTEANRLKAEVEKAVIENKAELMRTMREIAVAEINGNWFQSSWRPLLSYLLIFLVFWLGFLKGIMEITFGINIESLSFDNLITFGTVWASVYGLGRTFEKTGSSVGVRKD